MLATPFLARKKPIISRFFLTLTLFATGLPCLADAGVAPPGALLDEARAVALALERGALQATIASTISAAEGEASATRRWQNPVLSYTFEQAKGGGTGSDEGIVFLQQTIEPSRRRGLRSRAADAEVERQRKRSEMLRIEVATRVREVFFATLAAEERVEAAEEWQGRMGRVAAVVQLRQKAGDVSGFDLRRVQREQASASAEAMAEQARLGELREKLNGLVGTFQGNLGQAHWLAGELLPQESPPSLSDLLRSLQERPDIRALQLEGEAAHLAERVAREWKVPSFTVGAGFKQSRAGGPDADGPVVYAAIPLPIWDQNRGVTATATGRRRRAQAAASLLLQEESAALRGVFLKERQLVLVARSFLEASRHPSEELLKTAEAAYTAGEISVLGLLDSYQSAYQVRTRCLALALEARQARIELDRLTGRLFP